MKLHSQIIGEGEPLLILHGFLGMGDNWKTLANEFSGLGYQVHLIDQRNHGRSFHAEEFSYEVMADDLQEDFEAQAIENAIVLGHSMGGKTAMKFATKHPGLTSKLIVVDIGPKAYPQHHQDILMALSMLDFQTLKSRGEAEEVLSAYIKEWGVRQFLLKNLYWKEKGQLALRMNLPVLRETIEEIGKPLDAEALYLGPTIFIAGGRSSYIEDVDALLIHRHFPTARIEMIPDAGHWVHAEAPEAFFAAVKRFLEES